MTNTQSLIFQIIKRIFLKLMREKEDFNKNYFFSVKMLKKLAEKKEFKNCISTAPRSRFGKSKKKI